MKTETIKRRKHDFHDEFITWLFLFFSSRVYFCTWIQRRERLALTVGFCREGFLRWIKACVYFTVWLTSVSSEQKVLQLIRAECLKLHSTSQQDKVTLSRENSSAPMNQTKKAAELYKVFTKGLTLRVHDVMRKHRKEENKVDLKKIGNHQTKWLKQIFFMFCSFKKKNLN